MKVIFLDFDGVLNSAASFILNLRKTKAQRNDIPVNEILCHVCCSNLQYIIDKTPGVKIVLSTTWRELYDMDWLKAKLAEFGIDSTLVIDRTPTLFKGRGYEIQKWLDDHPEVQDQFVVLDDNDDRIAEVFGMSGLPTSNFVQTKWRSGLQIDEALIAIKILGGHGDGRDIPL